MLRLHADADPERWIPVTGSLGLRGRRHRKKAIGMLLARGNAAVGAEPRSGSRFAAWAASQAAPLLMRRADGRVLVWMWKSDPELVVVLAQVQEATPQLRAARAMMPMEYDDTEAFRTPHLGAGEKLVVALPPDPAASPFATYTWDLGTHIVSLHAVGGDRERFGLAVAEVERIAQTLRVVDDLQIGEAGEVLRLPPA
ncbi:hypothetical protein [Microbacterium sp. SORGH_AS_0888]|uniref:hypothetical protein n=1 Tax=Microbacterium sp. SORGH_AS_0888 TaxID=3041791 RepID=UPI00277E2220|nr:hypothetical protein [Microbacterium sp. SORGH_AS_0888]MDQ1129788.1 hypothetical protein [Microbacterium sp. SORGH_AS_0888]